MSAQTAEVVVVGAGVNGAAAAHHLVRKGVRDVLVVDRGAVAAGPTGASSAIVRQHYGHEPTALMALGSLRFFQHFEELTGGQAEFKTCGAIIAGPESAQETIRAVVEMERRAGIRTEMIGPEEVHELEPDMFVEDVAGAAWEPEAGYADPVGTTAGLVASAVRGGARCWLDTPVTAILTRGDRVSGVATSRGTVACERVVIAAGPWTAPLARTAGVEVPIRTSRHPVLVFQHPGGRRPGHILFDLDQIMYLRPEGGDMTLVGTLDMAHSRDDADPDDFDREPTFDEVSAWGGMLLRRFPEYADVQARRGWCGVYEYSPDWHHVIDELPAARGCWIVCGTSGHGFKLGPAAGDIVSDLALGREPAYDVADFRLDRFALGRAVTNRYAKTIIG